ncbi:caspase family protein [uncultured Ruegeria sp.]|uniref:caspase family protein n=1 Tax=uncultured Ruegeria sp. TaxID=259304 RepID=UPI002620A871|nr:caspase family protein [uncultured Ruegeria sp.]
MTAAEMVAAAAATVAAAVAAAVLVVAAAEAGVETVGPRIFRYNLKARVLCGLLALCLWINPALAQSTTDTSIQTPIAPRIAIVIGNQDYMNVGDLANARKDAQDIAALLREFNFKVYDGYDLEKREFEELLRTAVLNIPDSANVLFYYAGHGIQIGRRNYLLPVDAKFESIYDVPLATMTLDRVIDTLSARSSAHVAILDSCRDNPFSDIRLAADLDANLFETRTGFDVFRTPLNSLVAYSTSPGAVASDGASGQNSPYTAAVLETARNSPFENIQALFPVIREQVHSSTDGQQIPWESSTLVKPFYLAQSQAEPTEEPPQATISRSLDLTRQFDKNVPLSQLLEQALGTDIDTVQLVERPEQGVIAIGGGQQSGAINYTPEISDIRAVDIITSDVEDTFTVEVVTTGQQRQRVDVSLKLNMNPCDLEAGDALDLNGVGVFRLPNEINITKGLEACRAAVAANPDNARFRYQLGRVQQAAGQLSDAYANISAAAQAGHIRAKFALAVLLDSERIDRDVTRIPLDPQMALELLEQGTAEQDPYAMHRLGKKLLREGKTQEAKQRGFELLERSVELGHTFSMNELGLYFLREDSEHYIPERGMRYLRASELRKDIYGYNNLAYVALNGLGGNPVDNDKALEYFLAAAEGGHPTAPASVARMILRGQLPGRTKSEALDWYDASLARGDAWGGANGAYIILDGQVSGKGQADAALRAAKASLLADAEAAGQARDQLNSLPAVAQDRALQMALNELGQNVAVDGQVGPATKKALEDVAIAHGVPISTAALNDPKERLILAARVYWAINPVRFDLF